MAKPDMDLRYTRGEALRWRLRAPAAKVTAGALCLALAGGVVLQWPTIGSALGGAQAAPQPTAAEQKAADQLDQARETLVVLNKELKSALSDSTLVAKADKAPATQTLATCVAVAGADTSTLKAIDDCSDAAGAAKGEVLDQARIAAAETVSEKAATAAALAAEAAHVAAEKAAVDAGVTYTRPVGGGETGLTSGSITVTCDSYTDLDFVVTADGILTLATGGPSALVANGYGTLEKSELLTEAGQVTARYTSTGGPAQITWTASRAEHVNCTS